MNLLCGSMWSSSVKRLHQHHAQTACVKHLAPYCVLQDEAAWLLLEQCILQCFSRTVTVNLRGSGNSELSSQHPPWVYHEIFGDIQKSEIGENEVRKSSCEPLVAFIGLTKFDQAWEGAHSEEFPPPTCVKSGFSAP